MEEMPYLDLAVISVTLDRATGRVDLNHEGMNYLEAIGCLTVALNQIQETPFEIEFDDWSEDEED
jgi:hypothetical protein